MSESKSVRDELKRQREEVAASLAGLDKTRAETVQTHSFARARERAGVGEPSSGATAQLKADEAAAHDAMRAARAELHRLDVEIESQRRPGLLAKLRSALHRGDR